MEFSDLNSLALPMPATKLRDDGGTRDGLKARGAKVLESMGQRAEFERQIKNHLDESMRLATRLMGNQDQAEELVQETMLRAIRSRDSFRGQSQFKTWLYRILINTFRDHLRRRPKLEIAETPPADCLSRAPTAARIAEADELGERVAVLIAALPPRQREVLVLSCYESCSTQQIADALGISVANVHSTLCAARGKLKDQLSEHLGND